MTDEIKKQIEAEAKNYSEGIHTNIFMAGACALDKIQNLDIKKAKNILDLIKQNCNLMSREQKLLAELARLEDVLKAIEYWPSRAQNRATKTIAAHEQFKRELDLK